MYRISNVCGNKRIRSTRIVSEVTVLLPFMQAGMEGARDAWQTFKTGLEKWKLGFFLSFLGAYSYVRMEGRKEGLNAWLRDMKWHLTSPTYATPEIDFTTWLHLRDNTSTVERREKGRSNAVREKEREIWISFTASERSWARIEEGAISFRWLAGS